MDPFNSQYILKEKRWLWIDYDKGISIILVGYGHCFGLLRDHGVSFENYPFFNYIGIFLYGFRMPLFFIVSGLLIARSLDKKGLKAYIGSRANNILYPLLVWGGIQITLQIIMSRLSGNHVGPENYLDLIIDPRKNGHFWYLNALFCIGVIYAFLHSKLKVSTIMQVVFGLILFSVSSYLHLNRLNGGFITDICQFYIFFAIGDLASKIMLNQENIRRFSTWKIFVPLFIAFLIIQYIFTEYNLKPTIEGMNYVEHMMPGFYFFEALVGCAASVSLSFLLQKYQALTFLRVIGFHSLYIYCMQIIVMVVSRYFFINLLHIQSVPALILLIWSSGVLLPIFFYNFCLSINAWWLYTYKKPEKQVEYLRNNNIFSLKKSEIEEFGVID